MVRYELTHGEEGKVLINGKPVVAVPTQTEEQLRRLQDADPDSIYLSVADLHDRIREGQVARYLCKRFGQAVPSDPYPRSSK